MGRRRFQTLIPMRARSSRSNATRKFNDTARIRSPVRNAAAAPPGAWRSYRRPVSRLCGSGSFVGRKRKVISWHAAMT